MSNIERKYSYLDEGVFPEEGEYGVTYLTLYSSGAGNVYDGWMWDPDRVHYSETERTFGYRNPDYPDYCWDDEVVVDLSNAQSRQESSEFAQGRITSFNTNVSSRPIVLQDIDITGLDEEEREALATTVLFSAIPLVKDAYIQAMVEVQCKVNLSPTNTNGMVRVEAFYILNDESDRTMRPNPVHTFAVSTANERHTLPWLYWNPALNHEDNNYIGVKLLCTGGTAEIGISDDPEYGDAMITLTSAGLTGDHIDSGYPVSLDIYGKSMVPPGYKLKESDYTVLCTYDTGEVYEVTRLCEFTPPMGTKVVDAVTTLTAEYHGLTASMSIVLAQLEEIQLIPVSMQYEDEYTFDISDYTVLAYFDSGDIMDITEDENTVYSPVMGTTITQTTTLTATYTPEWAPGSSFSDSQTIEIVSSGVPVVTTGVDIIYTLYDNGTLVISGQVDDSWTVVSDSFIGSEFYEYSAQVRGHGINGRTSQSTYNWRPGNTNYDNLASSYYEIKIPYLSSYYGVSIRKVKYELLGKPLGFVRPSNIDSGGGYNFNSDIEFVGFENMDTSKMVSMARAFTRSNNDFSQNGYLELDLSFLNDLTFPSLKDMAYTFRHFNLSYEKSGINNIDTSNVINFSDTFWNSKIDDDTAVSSMNVNEGKYFAGMFCRETGNTSELDNIDFLYDWDMNNAIITAVMFSTWTNITNINGVRNLGMSNLENSKGMFRSCSELISISDTIGRWNNVKLSNSQEMFNGCTKLKVIDYNSAFYTNMVQDANISYMFKNSGLESTMGLTIGSNIRYIAGLFQDCSELHDLSGCASWYMGNKTHIGFLFANCPIDASSISYLVGWDMSNIMAMQSFMNNPPKVPSSHPDTRHPYEYPALDLLSNWNVKRQQGISMNDSGAFGSSSTSAVLPTVVTYDPDTQRYGLKVVPTWYKNRTT